MSGMSGWNEDPWDPEILYRITRGMATPVLADEEPSEDDSSRGKFHHTFKRLRAKMAQPKKVVKAWRNVSMTGGYKLRPKVEQGMNEDQRNMAHKLISSLETAAKLSKQDSWSPMSVEDLPNYSGEVFLVYEDGTTAVCSLDKGVMDGEYKHYGKRNDKLADPDHRGAQLEVGQYHKGWRVGPWLTNTALIEKEGEFLGGEICEIHEDKHTRGAKICMHLLLDPSPIDKDAFVPDLNAPIGIIKVGGDVMECPFAERIIRVRRLPEHEEPPQTPKSMPQDDKPVRQPLVITLPPEKKPKKKPKEDPRRMRPYLRDRM